MAATEQEMMERAARIQTIEELREVSAELGLELSPEKEAAFMAVRTAERRAHRATAGCDRRRGLSCRVPV